MGLYPLQAFPRLASTFTCGHPCATQFILNYYDAVQVGNKINLLKFSQAIAHICIEHYCLILKGLNSFLWIITDNHQVEVTH